MMHGKLRILLFTVTILSASCGPGLLEGEEFEDSDEMTGSDLLTIRATLSVDTEDEMRLCPDHEMMNCGNDMGIMSNLFQAVSASWIGDGAVFSHFRTNLILGYRTNNFETLPFALQIDFSKACTQTYFNENAVVNYFAAEKPASLEWIGAIKKNTGILNTDLPYMAAASDGESYFLVNVAESPMEILPETKLVTDAVLTDSVYLRNKSDMESPALEQVCLYGEGLFCYDGDRWITEISPNEAFTVHSIAVANINQQPMILAVGDDNVILTKYNNIWSSVQLHSGDAPLLEISVNSISQYFTAAGDQFLLFGAADRPIQRCDVAPHILRFNYFFGTDEFAILATDGQIWTGVLDLFSSGKLCRTGNKVDRAVDAIPSGEYYYVLSADGLYAPDGIFDELVPE
ncbi:MAG: hypothetical protein JXX29_13640 [Deltaproteobacteria bacterium]|nr:hypothetical protein [Deltaproteobacteria bacterium]MBN2672722.1 hypothetical protein [Deltaproteobacteria bacterium]